MTWIPQKFSLSHVDVNQIIKRQANVVKYIPRIKNHSHTEYKIYTRINNANSHNKVSKRWPTC